MNIFIDSAHALCETLALMSSKTTGIVSLLALIAVALLALFGLGGALIPLLVAAFMAYILLPLVKRLEKRGIRKEIAVVAAIVFTVLFWGVALAFLIPALIDDAQAFFLSFPSYAETAIDRAEAIASRFGLPLPLGKDDLIAQARTYMSQIPIDAVKSAGKFFGRALAGAAGLLIAILNLLLIPIFFFHLVSRYERIVDGLRALVPPRHRAWFDSFLERANRIISGYFRGQLLVALILGVLYGTGFWITGLRFGFIVGFLTGLLNVIPYAGPAIGLATATTVALANYEGFGSLASVWAAFAVVQALESFIITPWIVGDRVGLNALETMLALIIGGNLAGFAGMLVAVPVAGITKLLLGECRRQYQESDLYLPRGGRRTRP